jgi:type VI secretion system VasD/TssJ family lipoprotein
MNMGGNAAVVKLYQLKGDGNFRSVPFSTFWRDDEAALGGELLEAPRKVTVYPADSSTIEFDLLDKAQHIGVAANLRKPDQDEWRFTHPVREMGDEVAVTVTEDRIEVDVEGRSVLRRLWDLF